ncbi:DUF2306 domain-containing protein [Robertkochia solimangrovi]|uniref:DUF2306 domain-containing protein n=1 Tax=Robertkochia solimangrovi TaxID=2213046 RepID=UPI00117DEF15|nr:DUF2306 domain-containing protein [Robertkochia solimangrovi]TRZ44341.1 DUF2306 domain-containing protein [Robertkochia solimangrovi]
MENIITTLIYIHAGFGGIALFAGLISLIVKKGNTIHKRSGLVFFYAMLCSGLIALIVSCLPGHESPFLFAIGIFSLYFVLSGYRALRFKKPNINLTLDTWISRMMILTGILMIVLPMVNSGKLNIVLSVFGAFGIYFAIRDLRLYKDPKKVRKSWLKIHLGKMIGGYIAATTAFVVVNGFFPGISGWFIPSVIGGIYIVYWMRKVTKKTPASINT